MTSARQQSLPLGPTAPGVLVASGVDSLPEVITPRPYQLEAIDALYAWWATRKGENPCVVLPTAAGKTIVFSLLVQRLIGEFEDVRVLILAHRQELLEQAEAKLLRVWPEAPTGVYCAGLGRRQVRQVTIASRDSIAHADPEALGEGFHVVIVDEAHRIGEEEQTRYQQIFATIRELQPQATIVGFTATPYRTDTGKVYGKGRIFAGVAYEETIRQMVRDGYLSDIRAAAVRSQIDVSGIRTVAGDYSPKQLGERAVRTDLLDAQLDEWESRARDRTCSVFFCVNVEHAELVSDRLLERGFVVPAVHAKTHRDERAEALRQLDAGDIDGVANVGVLTEGWDCPRLDCIAILRPTKSLNLFVQMVGRGLRLSPETGKADCLLLDFGGCLERFGPIDRARPVPKGRAQAEERVKECPSCDALLPPATKECPHCQHVFKCDALLCDRCGAENPLSAAQCEACSALLNREGVEDQASTAPVFSDQAPRKRDVRCFEVDEVTVSTHVSKAGRCYLRVHYRCGWESFNEVVCLGYDGFAGKKAMRQMRRMLREGYEDMPSTDPDTFVGWHEQTPGGLLKQARAIYVDMESEWKDVTHVEYWTEATRAAAAAIAAGEPDPVVAALDDEIPF